MNYDQAQEHLGRLVVLCGGFNDSIQFFNQQTERVQQLEDELVKLKAWSEKWMDLLCKARNHYRDLAEAKGDL